MVKIRGKERRLKLKPNTEKEEGGKKRQRKKKDRRQSRTCSLRRQLVHEHVGFGSCIILLDGVACCGPPVLHISRVYKVPQHDA